MGRICICDAPECDGVNHPPFQPALDPDEVRRALMRYVGGWQVTKADMDAICAAAEAWLKEHG